MKESWLHIGIIQSLSNFINKKKTQQEVLETNSRTSTNRGVNKLELPMITGKGRMGLTGGVVESRLDCLYISDKENQTTSVVLIKNGVMCAT